jgi:hypothetical protein
VPACVNAHSEPLQCEVVYLLLPAGSHCALQAVPEQTNKQIGTFPQESTVHCTHAMSNVYDMLLRNARTSLQRHCVDELIL